MYVELGDVQSLREAAQYIECCGLWCGPGDWPGDVHGADLPGDPVSVHGAFAVVAGRSGLADWATRPVIVRAAGLAAGHIGLDPADSVSLDRWGRGCPAHVVVAGLRMAALLTEGSS
ncbi:MAG: hypothetical protein ACRD0V_09165 [Acidimicrobiales bacterium]